MARRHHWPQAGPTETGLAQIGITGIEPHIMPLRSRRSSLRALLAQRIRPDRLSGNISRRPGIGFVGGKDLRNLFLDRRIRRLQEPISQ